ncbi:MAG: hemerythrin domain-containing protein [Bacteroidales bacterium]|jgi:regulator of cell morphogenesis and NO signaling|nr:hemerythrin domain-containing protein [Bacteroidales bacterium]
MKHGLFTAKMKLSDLLFADYNLILVLSRFGIKLGFGEKSVEEVCNKYHISSPLFLVVVNVSTYSEYFPDESEIVLLNVNELIDYLHASHIYYLEDKISSIEKQLKELYSKDEKRYGEMIERFFSEYKNEVVNHFSYEENTVFPYIRNLLKQNTKVNYHINQFEKNHSNIEDKLTDLINILIKYLPENERNKEKENALFNIFLFTKDLSKHILIENKVLVPCVKLIEEKYEQR